MGYGRKEVFIALQMLILKAEGLQIPQNGIVGVVGGDGESETWEKRPHTEDTEAQSFLEHRGERALAERAQRAISN